LNELNIELSTKDAVNTKIALSAADVVEKYDFKRFSKPLHDNIPSRVISINEFRKNPEKYFHKLGKGFFNFPVGLNFEEINNFMYGVFGNASIESQSFSNKGLVKFVPNSICDLYNFTNNASGHFQSVLINASNLSDLGRGNSDTWLSLDALDFLYNYDSFENFFKEFSDLEIPCKLSGLKALRFLKFTTLTALEVVGTARICDASDLLNYFEKTTDTKSDEPTKLSIDDCVCDSLSESIDFDLISTGTELKNKIKDSLLSCPLGTSYKEIQGLLEIESKERFVKLASRRTLEILSNDKELKGLTSVIGKKLENYTIGESIVLACYFARNIIANYETLEDGVENIFSNLNNYGVSGKCTDYTGLALHYLREYLVPLNSEKFKNWHFGFDNDIIGDYKHCYIKIVHINKDKTADVYFVDPTKLANYGLDKLKTPKEVMDKLNTENNPILIERTAEDLLYKPDLDDDIN